MAKRRHVLFMRNTNDIEFIYLVHLSHLPEKTTTEGIIDSSASLCLTIYAMSSAYVMNCNPNNNTLDYFTPFSTHYPRVPL